MSAQEIVRVELQKLIRPTDNPIEMSPTRGGGFCVSGPCQLDGRDLIEMCNKASVDLDVDFKLGVPLLRFRSDSEWAPAIPMSKDNFILEISRSSAVTTAESATISELDPMIAGSTRVIRVAADSMKVSRALLAAILATPTALDARMYSESGRTFMDIMLARETPLANGLSFLIASGALGGPVRCVLNTKKEKRKRKRKNKGARGTNTNRCGKK